MNLPKESQVVEYKRKWRDDFLKELCAFANSQGGTLYIGVEDDGSIAKLDNVQVLMENLPNKIHSNLGFYAEVNSHTDDETGWKYLSVVVLPQNEAISYNGKYYIRSGSTTQELRGHELANFLLRKMKMTWDGLICERAKLSDIEREAIDYFLECAIEIGRMPKSSKNDTTEDILKNLELMTEDGQLTNAAVLLFGKNPQHFFINSRFRLGRFGSRESDLMFQDEIEGDLVRMADKIIDVLRSKYLISPIHYEGLKRKEDLEIPEEGMRELLYNAIVHRDYMGMDTFMKVYNDKIWLWNEGVLPEGYNTETMLKPHRSQPRNKLIAKVFFRAGFIESWGRGWDKVARECKRVNVELPTIETFDGGTLVAIKRPIIDATQQEANQGEFDALIKKLEARGIVLTDRQRLIVEWVCEHPKTTYKEMAEKCGVSIQTVFGDFQILQEKGVLAGDGHTSKKVWKVLDE